MIALLQTFILCIIHLLTPKSQADELDMSLKFIDELDTSGIEVETDSGWQPIRKVFKTRDYEIIRIKTESGLELMCADLHRLFDQNMNVVYASELTTASFIQTRYGIQRVSKVTKTGFRVQMYDIEVDHSEHRYWSNDILSHNTTTTAIFFTHFSLFNTDKCAAIAAQRDQIAGEVFSKIKSIISYLPFFLKPGCLSFSSKGYKFDNGCSALYRPATIDCLQGYTIDLLFVDEFAYIKQTKAVEFWNNVYPTMSSMTNSRVIITSTPNGRNLFYELWTRALEKKNLFKTFRIDWWEVPGRDEKWRQQETANLGSEAAFAQQYGLSFDTGVKNALTPDTYHYLNKISTEFTEGMFKIGTDYDEYFRWSTRWKYNLRKDWFLISVDIGEGLGSDYSVIKIRKLFMNDDGTIIMPTIGIFECNTIQITDFAKVIMFMMRRFNQDQTRLVIERNTYGDIMIKDIDSLTEKLVNVEIALETYAKFRRSVDNKKMEKGLRLNRQSKRLGVAAWKQLVDNKIFIETDSRVIDQYREFGDDGRGNYKAGVGHDDLVMPDVNAAFYVKSENPGWQEFVEEFRNQQSADAFNTRLMVQLNLVAIKEIEKDTTYDGNEYEILEEITFEIEEDSNEYASLDKYLSKNRKRTEEDDDYENEYDMIAKAANILDKERKGLISESSLSREERMMQIAKDLV